MAFSNKSIKFHLFDEEPNDDKGCKPLDAASVRKLVSGFGSAFERSGRKEGNVVAIAVLSDNVFLAEEDARSMYGVIVENEGQIVSSVGPVLIIHTLKGHFINLSFGWREQCHSICCELSTSWYNLSKKISSEGGSEGCSKCSSEAASDSHHRRSGLAGNQIRRAV